MLNAYDKNLRHIMITLCPTWSAWGLNRRPPAPETNALPLDQLALKNKNETMENKSARWMGR